MGGQRRLCVHTGSGGLPDLLAWRVPTLRRRGRVSSCVAPSGRLGELSPFKPLHHKAGHPGGTSRKNREALRAKGCRWARWRVAGSGGDERWAARGPAGKCAQRCPQSPTMRPPARFGPRTTLRGPCGGVGRGAVPTRRVPEGCRVLLRSPPLPTDHGNVPAHGPAAPGGPLNSRGIASFSGLRIPTWTPVVRAAAWVLAAHRRAAQLWPTQGMPAPPRGAPPAVQRSPGVPSKVTRTRAAALRSA